MAKYSLMVTRVNNERYVMINATGEKVFENENHVRYAELRKKAITNQKASSYRKAMDYAAESCGLVKVYGAVSGKVYYE
jgi:hypothetical protein